LQGKLAYLPLEILKVILACLEEHLVWLHERLCFQFLVVSRDERQLII
jgi:hypothetical protein